MVELMVVSLVAFLLGFYACAALWEHAIRRKGMNPDTFRYDPFARWRR